MPRHLVSFCALAAALGLCSLGRAEQIVSLTFDELPVETELNPSVTVEGITFTYAGGGFAYYNSVITFDQGVDALNLEDSVLEGDTLGTLTIDFLAAALDLEFALALSTLETLTPGFSVTLFGPGHVLVGSIDLTTTPLIAGTGFSEGLFSWSGGLIKRVVITFKASVAESAGTFAIDNLKARVVPEPSSLALAGIGLFAVVAAHALRRSRNARIRHFYAGNPV